MDSEQQERLRQGDEFYETYGKPLEADHWGEYIVIALDGRTVLGETPVAAAQRAVDTFGRGGFIFKVGEKAVYTLR